MLPQDNIKLLQKVLWETSQPGPQGKLGNQTPICQVLNFPHHHGDPTVSLTSCKLNSHKRPCHQPFATKLDFVVPRTCQQLVSWVCCCASPKQKPKSFWSKFIP